jgi:hypothetical protein
MLRHRRRPKQEAGQGFRPRSIRRTRRSKTRPPVAPGARAASSQRTSTTYTGPKPLAETWSAAATTTSRGSTKPTGVRPPPRCYPRPERSRAEPRRHLPRGTSSAISPTRRAAARDQTATGGDPRPARLGQCRECRKQARRGRRHGTHAATGDPRPDRARPTKPTRDRVEDEVLLAGTGLWLWPPGCRAIIPPLRGPAAAHLQGLPPV